MTINTLSKNFSFEIRVAVLEDVFSLGRIEKSAATIFDPGIIPIELRDKTLPLYLLYEGVKNKSLWVAFVPESEQQTIVGFALARSVEKFGHLAQIDVHPNFMQRGIGSSLVRRVISWAKEAERDELWLTTFEKIAWNAPFYKKFGFEEAVEKDQPDWIKFIRMKEEQQLPLSERIAMRLCL